MQKKRINNMASEQSYDLEVQWIISVLNKINNNNEVYTFEEFFKNYKTFSQEQKEKIKKVIYESKNNTFIDYIFKIEDMKKRNTIFTPITEIVQQYLKVSQYQLASELISEKIKEEYSIYTVKNDQKSEMWYYDDGIYKPHGKTTIREICRYVMGVEYTQKRAEYVIEKISADTTIDEDRFFNNEYVDEIPVRNGILDLRTKKLKNFTPNKIFFNKLPIKYVPGKKCPNIDKFLSEVLKHPEDKEVLYEKIGYCLWKEHFIEKATMFVGDGRNGKGKTLSLIKNFVGMNNVCSVSLGQMHHNSTSVSEMHGKLVNIAGDLSSTSLKDTGLFKEVVGRDPLGAKRKYLTDLHFVNYSKQFFACNELPRVYDMSYGFWSRWDLFEFPYKFVKRSEYKKAENKSNLKIRDERVIEKITSEDEMSGLLNKALNSLQKILSKGDFSYSQGTADVKDFWIRKSDSFAAFCMDMLEEEPEGYISKKDLRRVYMKYHRKHNVRGTSDSNIKAHLENNFGVVDDRKKIGDGDYERVWEGIKFKEPQKKIKTENKREKKESKANIKIEDFLKLVEKIDKINSHNGARTEEIADELGWNDEYVYEYLIQMKEKGYLFQNTPNSWKVLK